MRDLGERLKKKYSVLSAPSDIRQKTLKEHGSLVSLKGVFGRGRSRACITSWRWRCSGCSVHKEPRWVRQRERRSECNARQTLEKCETFPPIFKLSSRQIIPLQCESWFARSNSRSSCSCATPRPVLHSKIPILAQDFNSMCPSEKGRRTASGADQRRESSECKPQARDQNITSRLLATPLKPVDANPWVALSSTLSDI